MQNITLEDIEKNQIKPTKSPSYSTLTSKFHKIGNCYIYNPTYLPSKIVIGPHWYLFPLGLSFFIGIQIALLKYFRHYLPPLIIFFNLLITFLLCFVYFLIILKDPGIVFKKKLDFDDDSAIVCDICLTTVRDCARHCDYCGVCIREMDHHCPWISKCQGRGNRWEFYAFVGLAGAYYGFVMVVTCGYFLVFKHFI